MHDAFAMSEIDVFRYPFSKKSLIAVEEISCRRSSSSAFFLASVIAKASTAPFVPQELSCPFFLHHSTLSFNRQFSESGRSCLTRYIDHSVIDRLVN